MSTKEIKYVSNCCGTAPTDSKIKLPQDKSHWVKIAKEAILKATI